MKYFTKKWYKMTLEEKAHPKTVVKGKGIVGRMKAARNKNEDTTMKDYLRQFEKIESKVPDCLRTTLHNSVITAVSREGDTLVIEFDNTNGFSDIEKMYLYDATVTEMECELNGKTWLNEEINIAGTGFVISALLIDENGALYYFTVHFNHIESVLTNYTDSTEAGTAETLESIFSLCAEECGLDMSNPDGECLINCIKKLSTYKIADENQYRFEAGIYNNACEEFFDLIFTRQVYTRNGIYQLMICFAYPPDENNEELSDTICSDVFDDLNLFFDAVSASNAFVTAMKSLTPIKSYVHAEQI